MSLTEALKEVNNARAEAMAQWDVLAIKLSLLSEAESQTEREVLASEAMDLEIDIAGDCPITVAYAESLGLDTSRINDEDFAVRLAHLGTKKNPG